MMKMKAPQLLAILSGALALTCPLTAYATDPLASTGASTPEATNSADDLVKQLANPVASLISMPFQANWDFGIGVNDATRFTMNI